MSTHVLLGRNGYIGREVTRQWLAADPQATFLVISSSGRNELTDPRVTTVVADATDYDSLAQALPAQIDTIVDFLGRPDSDPTALGRINLVPARLMERLALERGAKAMGMIGGTLGPMSFTQLKRQIIDELSKSSVPVAVVEPTLVYGAGRRDATSTLVPLLKLMGGLFPKVKPVRVEDVAAELVTKLRAVAG